MISCNETGPFVLSVGAGRAGALALAACGACLAVALTATEAPARGSFRLQEAWSSEHIARLPADVRSQVVSVCQGGVAHRTFAGYYPDRIVLHYEHLHCSDRPAQCDGSGCLHQEYAFEHGGWHLVKSYRHAGKD